MKLVLILKEAPLSILSSGVWVVESIPPQLLQIFLKADRAYYIGEGVKKWAELHNLKTVLIPYNYSDKNVYFVVIKKNRIIYPFRRDLWE